MDIDLPELAALLVQLGCPAERSREMAAQLDKRATQLAAAKGRPHEEALAHLLRLMAQGWASPARAAGSAETEPPVPPEAPGAGAADGSAPAGVRPWPLVRSEPRGDFRVFQVRSDIRVSPRTGREHDFYVIESVNWVTILALTPRRELVMVEQFRHGSGTIELEIPGGMMEPGETDPVGTAVRELQEETGHTGRGAQVIGCVSPNPPLFNNTCYNVLVEDCTATHPTSPDAGEDIAVRLVPLAEVARLVAGGQIRHALVIAALHHLDLWERGVRG